MAITAAFPNTSKLEALQAICPPGSTYKMALYTSAATLGKATSTYTTAGEVVGTGYTAGGIVLTGYTASMDGDVAILDFNDPQWDNATLTAGGATIYETGSLKVRAVLLFAPEYTSTNGPFKVTLPPPAAATAVIRIA